MLRPSDIAPKTELYDSEAGFNKTLIFSTDQVHFLPDGNLKLVFFGIKNDTSRDGFEVTVPPASESKLDPVSSLKCYIARTAKLRSKKTKPVFLSCKKPHRAICAATVASILNKSIRLAGLDDSIYSAKSFRPSGATAAIEAGINPDKARRIGRWKTESVFFDHYVHDKTAASYTDSILNVRN